MDTTQGPSRLSSHTLPSPVGVPPLVPENPDMALPDRLLGPDSPGRRRSDLEAVGLLIAVLSVLFALAVGLGVAPGNLI